MTRKLRPLRIGALKTFNTPFDTRRFPCIPTWEQRTRQGAALLPHLIQTQNDEGFRHTFLDFLFFSCPLIMTL